MPVHDKRAVALLEIQKFIPDPMQIVQGLLREWNARAQPCVNKKKITAGKIILKTAKKETMRLRKNIEHAAMDVELGRFEIAARQPIGLKCLSRTDMHPGMKPGGIGKKRLQQRLMITAQAHGAPLSDPPRECFNHIL